VKRTVTADPSMHGAGEYRHPGIMMAAVAFPEGEL
jgi:hypothetical protein